MLFKLIIMSLVAVATTATAGLFIVIVDFFTVAAVCAVFVVFNAFVAAVII